MFLLGIAIAYLVVFVMQLFTSELLSIRLYFAVACVSVVLAITELLKRFFLGLNKEVEIMRVSMDTFCDIANQRSFDDEIEQKQAIATLREIFQVLPKVFEKQNKIVDILINAGYMISIVIMLVVPFLAIPETLLMNKIISLATLFAFALFFISIAVDDLFSDRYAEFNKEFNYFVEIEKLRTENIKLKETNGFLLDREKGE